MFDVLYRLFNRCWRARSVSVNLTSMFDLSEARQAVGKLRRRRRFVSLRRAVLPITAHLGSVGTIFTVYFFRVGSFAFDATSWVDWVVCAVLALVVASGLYITIRELRRSNGVIVERTELTNLLAVGRVDAETSAETLAGDLSWLEEEAPALRAVKEARPTLRITVFYDRDRVPPDLLLRVSELEDCGIELIPYPRGIVPRIRCMVVDRALPDATRACTYVRHGCEVAGVPRPRHQFEWHELSPSNTIVVSALSSMIAILRSTMTPTFRIGISGINNVGKTTCAARLRCMLQQRFTVDLIPDHFRTVGNGTELDDNSRMLFEQLADNHSNADVCIYDRTLIDNLCFLRMRNRQNESLYHKLAPVVASASTMLDLTVDIRAPANSPIRKTTHVSAADRKFVRRALDEFFSTYGVNRLRVEVDPDDFDASINRAVASAAERIEHVLRARKVADS